MKTRKKGEEKTKTNNFGAIEVQMWCKCGTHGTQQSTLTVINSIYVY
jgi:hypothetical protein